MTVVSLAYVARLLTMTVGIVFALSAVPKVRRTRRFLSDVLGYDILPAPTALVFAALVIVAEPTIAIATLTGFAAVPALIAAAALLVSFATAAGINLARQRQVRCGCFGGSDELISRSSFARVLCLLALSVAALVATVAAGPAMRTALDPAQLFSALLLVAAGSWLFRWPDLRVLTMEPPRRAATSLEAHE
jgi:hypothetical protein